jgi:hypothetical protein
MFPIFTFNEKEHFARYLSKDLINECKYYIIIKSQLQPSFNDGLYQINKSVVDCKINDAYLDSTGPCLFVWNNCALFKTKMCFGDISLALSLLLIEEDLIFMDDDVMRDVMLVIRRQSADKLVKYEELLFDAYFKCYEYHKLNEDD